MRFCLSVLSILVLCCLVRYSLAQTKIKSTSSSQESVDAKTDFPESTMPHSLRVDLLAYPDRVYDKGVLTSIPLEQAGQVNKILQFSCINSRFPVFSWVAPKGQVQQWAFQILLATTAEQLEKDSADVWNSGKVTNRNVSVLYSGTPLKPASVYYWKVRTWDKDGNVSLYSTVQSFRTGNELSDYSLPSFVLTRTLQLPSSARKLDTNITQYDFGADGFGQLRFSAACPDSNDTLFIQLGETLTSDGLIDTRPPGTVRYRFIKLPLRQGRHGYEVIISPDQRNTGDKAIHMPPYIGEVLPFRYVQISGNPEVCKIDSVSRYLVTAEFNNDATVFSSSDTTLNKIWDLCKYTIKATSFTGYYVDGDRERIPYEADALINQLSHYSCDTEFNMTKRTMEYLIYHPTWPTEWSLQNVLIAWNDYLYSGDSRLAMKLYTELKNKTLAALAREDGLISTRSGKQTAQFLKSIHYETFNGNNDLKDIVDWPAGERDGFVFSQYNAVVNAFYYENLNVMYRLSLSLGFKDDAIRYQGMAEKVKTSFVNTFIDKSTRLVVDGEGVSHSSLHANMFAMAFGLVPTANMAGVLSFIRSRGMACSVYGAQFLLDGLAQADESEYAIQLLTSQDKRSWLNMLREGATMTMEAWGQAYKPNQDWNHAWGTTPANYIVRHFMGVEPLIPGFAEVQIRPHPASVEKAELKYASVRGDIYVRFVNSRNTFDLNVELPGTMTATVYLPSESKNALVMMDGVKIKATYVAGYWRIPYVRPGKHLFQVSKL